MSIIRIYTDGGCSGNQERINFGGWGSRPRDGRASERTFRRRNQHHQQQDGADRRNRSLQSSQKDGLTIHVFSDSAYVANCFREKWYESWEKNKWKNAARKSVENQELWKELLSLVRKHDVTFYRVKGHVKLPKAAEGELPESAALRPCTKSSYAGTAAAFLTMILYI